jgi:microprocessor complex subunit DGCR8
MFFFTEKGKNHFEILPDGWTQVTHNSGMPIYLHRKYRVCSLSRPYFLGPGSVRKHEIPISSIPCLSYRKALDREKELMEEQRVLKEQQDKAAAEAAAAEAAIAEQNEENHKMSNGLSALLNLNNKNESASNAKPMPLPACIAKVETVSENLKAHSLTPLQFTEYCKKLFNFKTIRVLRFRSWSARRKFTKNRKHIKHLQRPTLPDGTKLVSYGAVFHAHKLKSSHKTDIMNEFLRRKKVILSAYIRKYPPHS